MKRPESLDKFLSAPSGELESLVTHARQLQRLQAQYRQQVPEKLANHCQVANFQRGVLTLCCQSSAWATRANMEKAQLLLRLREISAFGLLEDIEVITRPLTQAVEKKEKTIEISMSHESAEIISGMAEAISDPGLKEALRRLAQHKND
ncbi:MAG: DUF721 domain-containing protein [Gammaproteobacteria bacterium]